MAAGREKRFYPERVSGRSFPEPEPGTLQIPGARQNVGASILTLATDTLP